MNFSHKFCLNGKIKTKSLTFSRNTRDISEGKQFTSLGFEIGKTFVHKKCYWSNATAAKRKKIFVCVHLFLSKRIPSHLLLPLLPRMRNTHQSHHNKKMLASYFYFGIALTMEIFGFSRNFKIWLWILISYILKPN